MAKVLVPDDLWAVIAPLLPPERLKPKGGRPPIPDRATLTGILFVLKMFVLKTGLPWEYLPAEMGCGSGMSCWRRLHEWHKAGVWAALHRTLLERLAGAGQLDWRRAALDSASVPAKTGSTHALIGGRAEPNGPRQAGHQAAPRRRRARHAARRNPERGQPPRQHGHGGNA